MLSSKEGTRTAIPQQAVSQLSWSHVTVLVYKIKSQQGWDWYALASVEDGWSRNVLLNMIMNKTLERAVAAPANFAQQLVARNSELAQQVAKEPYNSKSSASPAQSPSPPS